ncbi:MAG: M48 family metallopeptidase [Bacteroidales bacterium]|nr:M48 family metallopeptidase [Candidatus Colicola equi]
MIKHLTHLRPSAYEHEFDRNALEKVKQFTFLNKVTNFLLNWTSVKWTMTNYQGSCFRVTSQSCPELYALLEDVAKTLDLDYMPKIYTEWSYLINAFTTGFRENTMISLNTGVIDLLKEEEVRFVVGHEMGHIKSGHVLYQQMLWYFSDVIDHIPGAGLVNLPFKLALLYWSRMAEFTADRAGLLACQDIDAALNAITKMAGVPQKYFVQTDKKNLLRQAEEFENENQDFWETTIREIAILDDSHPWLVLRAAELVKWYESDVYKKIINS